MELPRLTPALARLMDAPAKAEDPEGQWEAQWAFLHEVLPEDYLAEAVGATYEEADVPAMGAAYLAVVAVYAQPVLEANRRAAEGSIHVLEELDLSKVYRTADAIRTIADASRRGFSAVR